MLLSKIVLPVIIGIGIITNILVIVGMSNARMTVSASAKFYYLIIATGDLGILLSYNGIYTFLNRTLWYWSEKQLNINLLTSSSISCKIWVSCWNFAEILSGYGLVCFSIERLLAVYFPFHAKRFLNFKFSKLFFLITALIFGTIIPFQAFYNQVWLIPSSSRYTCGPSFRSELNARIFSLAKQFVYFFIQYCNSSSRLLS